MSEDETDDRTCVNELPEECHREVHSSCLKPYSNELISCILERRVAAKLISGHIKAMDGTEIASIILNGWQVLKSTMRAAHAKSKFGYEEEVKNECDWSHYDQFMKGGRKTALDIPPILRAML